VCVAAASVHPLTLPVGWAKTELLQLSETPVSFVLQLKESSAGIHNIKKLALAVSDPSSPAYGSFLNSAQLEALTAPKAEDVAHVRAWIESAGVTSYTVKGSRIEVTSTIEQAGLLFTTRFATLTNAKFGQTVHRAGEYSIPEDIDEHVQAVFGLHGLPLPPTGPLPTVTTAPPAEPADVTPAVLEQVYNITGVTPSAKSNRQAVAEFQGQYMSDKDLAAFFAKYVTKYKKGTDDVVSKYVGDKDKQIGQTEASLDIQYIMGVNPGLKAEFWLYNSMDFCGDLANWTAAILADDDAPQVHSISYGWQGNLSQLQCTDAKVSIVDDNFAKLAAKGISIIFASGDSGSGYSPTTNQCMSTPTKAEELTGTVLETLQVRDGMGCCDFATQNHAAGFSFNATVTPGPAPTRCATLSHAEAWVGTPTKTVSADTLDACCAATSYPERFSFFPATGGDKHGKCEIFPGVAQLKKSNFTSSGIAEPPEPAMGVCTLYKTVTGSKPNPEVQSAKAASHPKVVLWPSWPASSGWITAVGSTRFVDQKVGAEEMATDQFGSGGGFSHMFTIAEDASYQADAVKAYLAQKPGPGFMLPPNGSFPPGGRATPDVSALGEGYQVMQNGQVMSVGGTSASTPAFAGMIALLNDARIQAGKKQLGFLNPFLYKNQDAFTDVTKGNNAIGRGTFNLPYGFNATAGWDPVTGLGSPIFPKLLAAALKN